MHMIEILLMSILIIVLILVYFTEFHVDVRNQQDKCHEHQIEPCKDVHCDLCKNCPHRIITYSISSNKESK